MVITWCSPANHLVITAKNLLVLITLPPVQGLKTQTTPAYFALVKTSKDSEPLRVTFDIQSSPPKVFSTAITGGSPGDKVCCQQIRSSVSVKYL